MQHIIQWLFTDPITATGDTNHPEVFHFYVQWSVFNGLLILGWLYYWMEGRKRFFGRHWLHKSLLDRATNQFVILALVGFIVMFFRWAADSSLLADRFWRYGWLAWLAGLLIYWAVYFVRHYSNDINWFREQRIKQRYMNPPRNKAKQAKRAKSAAGAR